jgi:hypothetical protein
VRIPSLPPKWAKDKLWAKAREVPSLDLRFAENKSLVDATTGLDLVTFTRASSATYVDSQGQIQTAAINAPRFDHNPVTGESLGLLVEEQRTNLLLRSEEFDDASWTLGQTSVSANVTESPTASLTADKLIENTNSSTHLVQQIVTHTSGVAYTISCFVKAAERTFFSLAFGAGFTGGTQANSFFDLSGVTTPTPGATIVSLGNGWFRCSFTITATASASSAVQFRLATSTSVANYTGDGTSGLFLWGAQLEAGAFPTSYIPTGASAATRAADVCSISGSNFSSWYRQDEGTVFCRLSTSPQENSTLFAWTLYENEGNYLGLRSATGYSPDRVFNVSRVSSSNTFSSESNANGYVRVPVSDGRNAFAYKTDDFSTCWDGRVTFGSSSGALPSSLNQLVIGSLAGSSHLSGHICRLVFWRERLADNVLQSITQ